MTKLRIEVGETRSLRIVSLLKTSMQGDFMHIETTGGNFRRHVSYFPTQRHGWEQLLPACDNVIKRINKKSFLNPSAEPNYAIMHPVSATAYAAAWNVIHYKAFFPFELAHAVDNGIVFW